MLLGLAFSTLPLSLPCFVRCRVPLPFLSDVVSFFPRSVSRLFTSSFRRKHGITRKCRRPGSTVPRMFPEEIVPQRTERERRRSDHQMGCKFQSKHQVDLCSLLSVFRLISFISYKWFRKEEKSEVCIKDFFGSESLKFEEFLSTNSFYRLRF